MLDKCGINKVWHFTLPCEQGPSTTCGLVGQRIQPIVLSAAPPGCRLLCLQMFVQDLKTEASRRICYTDSLRVSMRCLWLIFTLWSTSRGNKMWFRHVWFTVDFSHVFRNLFCIYETWCNALEHGIRKRSNTKQCRRFRWIIPGRREGRCLS